MKRYMNHLIRCSERRAQEFLDMQIRDENRPGYGALEGELLEAKPTIYALAVAAAVYVNQDSRFFHRPELLEAMNLAMDFVGKCQREDGSFDYPSCNFKSAADTSFCFKRLIAAYRLLEQYESGSEDAGVAGLKGKYLAVMKKALAAIASGGFHTPNHRWGIAAALMQGAGLFRQDADFSKRLRDRAGQYLAEGIDGSPEGEYAERSTGNYNAVVNNAMMALYEETGDEAYLGYVARNLNMMLTYIDPDDTIFTQNSTRQDQGSADYPDKYFYQYLYMAAMTEGAKSPYSEYHGEFDAAAHKIIKDNMERGAMAPECLHIVMLHREMEAYQFQGYGFPREYRKFYREAGVLRVKNEKYGYSVLKGKSAFLFFKAGDMPVFVRIGESIGGNRSFLAGTMETDKGACTLTSVVDACYYLPFEEAPATSDWWKMDHSRREVLKAGSLKLTVEIKELEDGLELSAVSDGLDRVPLRILVCLPAGTVLENGQLCMSAGKGQSLILKDGFVNARYHGHVLELGPGFGTHSFGGHYSGEENYEAGFTVAFHDYTPMERKIRIKIIK